MYTRYWNTPTVELLRRAEELYGKSPIIDELAKRLQINPFQEPQLAFETKCPVCEAELVVGIDTAGLELFPRDDTPGAIKCRISKSN